MCAEQELAAGVSLTAGDGVSQPAVDPAGQLLVDWPEGQRAYLQQVNDDSADHEHVADDQVTKELGLQQLPQAHRFSADSALLLERPAMTERPHRHHRQTLPFLGYIINTVQPWRGQGHNPLNNNRGASSSQSQVFSLLIQT